MEPDDKGKAAGMSAAQGAEPLVSLITATLNAARDLPPTIASIARQRGVSFEWIVVDGGSADGTLELLRRHANLVRHWRSEPDAGIYDAWNKGCALARGQWLLFLGAGDELEGPSALAAFAEALGRAHPEHDLVYGRLRYISAAARAELDEVGEPWDKLAKRWELGRPALPPNQALFYHRSLFGPGRGFDARYRIAGDAAFVLRHALGKPPLFVPRTLVRVQMRGASMDLGHAAQMAGEIRRLTRELGLRAPPGHRLAETLLLAAKVGVSKMPAWLGMPIADGYRRLRGRPKRWSVR